MEIIQHIEHPSMRPQDIDLIEHVKYTIAQNYTSLFSRIDSHIEDEKRHITEEERTAWNSKVDKLALYEIEQKLVNKANRTELIELQETLARLKSAVDAIDSGASTGFVTESELLGQVQLIKELINSSTSGSLTPSDLNELSNSVYRLSVWKEGIDSWKQAIDTWKDNGGGTPSVDLSNYYTKAETDLKLTNYYSKSEVDELVVDTTAAEVTKKDIDDINDAIDDVRESVSNIHTVNEERIDEMIDTALEEYKGTILTGMDQKIADLDPGTIAHVPATWDDDLLSYISHVIKSYEEGDGASWSSLKQSYDSLASEVTSLRESIGEDGSINLETLQSNLESRIDEKTNTAITNLTNEWALKDLNNEDSAKKLKWAISGFTTEVDDEESLAKLYNDRFDGTNNAVSALDTRITTVDGKIDTAVANLTSTINNKTAGMVSQATLDEAIAGLFAEGGEGKASVTTAVRDGISSITEDADFINMVADKVSINSDVYIEDDNNIVVANINKLGFAEFVNGNIKAEYTTNSSTNEVEGISWTIKNPKSTDDIKATIQGSSVGFQRKNGTIISSMWSNPNADSDGFVLHMVANEYANDRTSQGSNSGEISLRGGTDPLLWTNTRIDADGIIRTNAKFRIGDDEGITQDVETLNGTLHINGGIITGFQGHDNNMHIELVNDSANINADTTSATAKLRSYYKASGSSIVKPMSWTCSTDASLVTSVSPNSGNGISSTSNSETISFVLQPNTSTSSRTAIITFTSATNPVTNGNKSVLFTITQAGKEETPTPTSTYDFRLTSNNSSMTFTEDSGSQLISYANTCTTGSSVTNPEVSYTSSNSSWLTATVGATSGYIRCSSNGSAYDRTGTITITQSGSNNKITINVTQSHTSEDVYTLSSPQSGQTLTLGATSGSTASFSITSYKISNLQTVAVPVSPYVHLGTSYFGNIQSNGSSGNTYYYTVSTLSQNDSSNYRTGFIAVTQPGSDHELVINLQQENTEEVITYGSEFGFIGDEMSDTDGAVFMAEDSKTTDVSFISYYNTNRSSLGIEQYAPVTVSVSNSWIHASVTGADEWVSTRLGGHVSITVDNYSNTSTNRTGWVKITQNGTGKTSTLKITQTKMSSSSTETYRFTIDPFVQKTNVEQLDGPWKIVLKRLSTDTDAVSGSSSSGGRINIDFPASWYDNNESVIMYLDYFPSDLYVNDGPSTNGSTSDEYGAIYWAGSVPAGGLMSWIFTPRNS